MSREPEKIPAIGQPVDVTRPTTAPRLLLGLVLMPVGIAAMVGGAILHFAVKAGKVDLFPYAGRFVILFGLGAAVVGVVLAGTRAAIAFGAVTLVAGIGMLMYGYVNIENPDIRFYAPLGFFIALAGGALIWAGRSFRDEMKSP